ncbi:MAG: glycosyltransferase family 4 protein [Candidatus Buchananbacteria bacterium]
MKKILIAAEIFPPDIGGPATYSQKIFNQFKKLGYAVELICYSDKPGADLAVRILRSKNPLKHYWRYFKKLKELAKDCDLIYAQGPVSSGLPAAIVGKILNKKVVVKVVGDYAWEQARNLKITEVGIDDFQKKSFGGKIGSLQRIQAWVCQQSAKVIVPSQYLKKIVSGWGVSEEKIEVIYNSFDLEFSDKFQTPDKNLIVSVGRLVPWKGFDTLIGLMPELLQQNSDFKLKIFGFGPQKERLEKLISDLKLENNVSISNVSHQEVVSNLSAAGIFVLNTGYEGLSHTILEAMAASVPVVTTNIGGNPELIENEKNGLLIEYNNKEELKAAILKIYNSPELGQKFVENSKKVLEKFTFEEMINRTVDVLESIK